MEWKPGSVKPLFSRPVLLWIVAGAFIVAGTAKAFDPAAFTLVIDNYRLLPFPFAAALALYLPWLEIAAGLGALWSRTRDGALLILSGLSLVFLAALVSAQLRGLDIACGCFGGNPADAADLYLPMARNSGLLLASALLLMDSLTQSKETKNWSPLPKRRPLVGGGAPPTPPTV